MGPLRGAKAYWLFILLLNLVNLMAMVGTLLFFCREKRLLRYWIFWGILIALFLFHGLTYMEPRYLFPAKSVIYVLGAAGFSTIPIVRRWLAGASHWFFVAPKH